MKKYPIARPYLGREEEKSVLEVLRSGYLSLGPKYMEFERNFAKRIGVKYACSVSSGTAGLHLAMIACGIRAGDEVITTPFSFVASSNCILYVGAKPVFVDIDPMTYNIDPDKIEAKINKKTKAILVVHIFGQSANMDPILKLAKKYKLQIIEDACESIDATYRKKKVGTFGEVGVFAFYPNKQMTVGEGGMVVTNSKKIYEVCCCLRNQGRAKDDQWLTHEFLGYNYRLDELSAALGVTQLEKLDYMIEKRRKIAGWYNEILKPYESIVQTPITDSKNTHTWFVYVIQIKDKRVDRNKLILNLENVGVNTRPYLPSIHLFGFYKKLFHYKKGDFPISEKVSQYSLALPMYIKLTKTDCELISKRLIKEIGKLVDNK